LHGSPCDLMLCDLKRVTTRPTARSGGDPRVFYFYFYYYSMGNKQKSEGIFIIFTGPLDFNVKP